jgi:hypothetical protein
MCLCAATQIARAATSPPPLSRLASMAAPAAVSSSSTALPCTMRSDTMTGGAMASPVSSAFMAFSDTCQRRARARVKHPRHNGTAAAVAPPTPACAAHP